MKHMLEDHLISLSYILEQSVSEYFVFGIHRTPFFYPQKLTVVDKRGNVHTYNEFARNC